MLDRGKKKQQFCISSLHLFLLLFNLKIKWKKKLKRSVNFAKSAFFSYIMLNYFNFGSEGILFSIFWHDLSTVTVCSLEHTSTVLPLLQ